MRLAVRLALLLLVLSTLPLAAVGWLAYSMSRQAIRSDTFHHLASTNVFREEELDRWIADNEETLRELASRPGVRELAAVLASRDPDDAQYRDAYNRLVEDHLAPTLENKGGFLDLSLLQVGDGLTVLSTDDTLEGQRRDGEPYFLEGQARTFVQDAAYSPELEEMVMYIGTPVNDADGDLTAVLAGRADLGQLSAILRRRSAQSGTEDTYLVNASCFFVTEPRFGDDYASEGEVRTEAIASCLEGSDGMAEYDDYREAAVIGAYDWIPERGVCILTEVDQAEAYAPITALGNAVLGLGAGAAVAVVVVGFLLAQSITGPVRRLVRGAAEIGRGNLAHRIPVTGRDEIGQMALAFNLMAANLRQSPGETNYSQRLLLALGQAAEAVQRARTAEDVYRRVGRELATLGYNASIFTVVKGGTHLAMPHLGFNERTLRAAERLVGLTRSFRFPIPEGGFYDRLITERAAAFREPFTEPIAEALPRGVKRLAGRVASLMGIEQGIAAPLVVGGDVYGLLLLHGSGLTRADIPAVTAFANQTAIALENALAEEELRKHRDHLEDLVRQRTAEMERANEELQTEIAERKRAEAALRSLSARYEAILAAAPDIIMEVDRNRVYTWANRAGLKFFGEDVLGKEAALYLEGDQDTYDTVQPLVNDDDTVVYVESWQRRHDGEKRLLAWWCRRLVDANGEVTGALSTARDITEHRQADEDLREYSDRLEAMVDERTEELSRTQDLLLRHERLAVLGQLAGGIGHELRNPLGAIKSAAYFLNMALADPDPDVKETLAILDREVAASDRIISSLLDFARPRTATRRKADLNAVVREVLARVEVPKNVKVSTRFSKELPSVLADHDQLTQVFSNIVLNALQAMPEGGRLEVKTREAKREGSAESSVVVSVKDSGIGIAEGNLRRIFEPLFTTKAKGIGLGLALSKTLIEAHGGEIDVESQEGKGTIFTVTLPLSGSA
jgi:PAS domain S-box-containing protein